MSELRRVVTLSLSGIVTMALAGLVESHLAFWSGLTLCALALMLLIRATLRESDTEVR